MPSTPSPFDTRRIRATIPLVSLFRAVILLTALVAHPILVRALPCGPLVAPQQAPACCTEFCLCESACGCTMQAPAIPDAPTPDPAPVPASGDLRASLPPLRPLIIMAADDPAPPTPARETTEPRPLISCDSLNALHCIWTT